MDIMKLNPVLKELIWGGRRLKEEWGMQTDLTNIAEDWALACHKQGMNLVANGVYKGKTLAAAINDNKNLLGVNAKKFAYFPILVKLIDAKDDLSIQVHPGDEYALKHEGEYGKTEMWYVLDCADDAQLIYGFKNQITPEAFKQAIEENILPEVLNTVKVKKGDVLFIEAGTVHAIGKGVLIAEIQQNSNTTYRVYDYNRLGADGKPRALHVQKAVDVAVCAPPSYPIAPKGEVQIFDGWCVTLLAECAFFTVNRYQVAKEAHFITSAATFKHVLITEGTGTISGIPFRRGDSFFIPAGYGECVIQGICEALITNI